MTCTCKKVKREGRKKQHNEWFKNLLEKKEKEKNKVQKKRKGMSTGGYTGKLEKL